MVLGSSQGLEILAANNPLPLKIVPAHASSSNASPPSYPKPVISGDLKAGGATIRGFIDPCAERVFVEVFADLSNGRRTLINRVQVASIDASTGAFTAKLDRKLEENQKVRVAGVIYENGARTSIASDEITVLSAPVPVPTIVKPLIEGAHSVSGIIDGKASKIEVVARSGDDFYERSFATEIGKDGSFEAKFGKPLLAGQTIKARGYSGEGEDERSGEWTEAEVQEIGNWGRARAEFAFGMVLSKKRDDFSKTDPYLNFKLDYNWYRRETEKSNLRYLFNTFFETRLTAIPVAMPMKKEKPNDDGKQNDGDNQDSDDNQNNGGQQNECENQDILCSKKSALVQAGAYLPIYWNKWTVWNHRGNHNALFVAPIMKAGLHTETEGKNESEKNNLLVSYSSGIRIGHFNLGPSADTPHSSAPRLISYLDITLGKFQNLKFDGKTLARTAFEGRLKIPHAPFQIGIDANIGRGPDDLRFVFDTSFDVAVLLKKLLQK
jgi:hypothetical protein